MPAPRPCSICTHERVAEIDRDLIAKEAGTRRLAEKYGVNRNSLRRHQQNHLAHSLAAASGAVVNRVEADPALLIGQVADLEMRARKLLDRAEAADDRANAVRALGQLRQVLELAAKLAGELSGSGLSRAEVKRIAREMARVVEAELRAEPERLERIRHGWRSIRF